MLTERQRLIAILILLGAGWGLTLPFSKITVTAGYAPFGIIFWQFLIGTFVLGALQWRRLGRLPLGPRAFAVWIFIAVIGTLIPNAASYQAAFHLPAGVMAIIIASIPMMALPMALALGTDRLSWRRLLGLSLGLTGVALIALPKASLPDAAMVGFLPLALLAPFCYAIEGNVVAKWGTGPLDPVQVLWGASALGTVMSLQIALSLDQFIRPQAPFQVADATLVGGAVIHIIVYTAYVWLVGRAGAVFAGQVSYLVTGFGVIWSIMLLDETYSGWVWAALALMLVGLMLVNPRTAVEDTLSTGEIHS